MRNSRVIEERETFDSAYPNTKGYDYYRNSYLQKKKKKIRGCSFQEGKIRRLVDPIFPLTFLLLFREKSQRIQLFWILKESVCVCVCHSTVIKIKFKVNDYF